MWETFTLMDPWVIATFMGASILLYLTPGADMMFTIASGISGGPSAGLAAAIGISLGVLVHVALAAAGLAVLVATSPMALDVVRYIGAGYLAWLAWHSWRANGALQEANGRAQIWRALRRGFLTNILNPKVALFILAFLPQFTDPNIGPAWQQIIILGVMLAAGGIVSDGVIGIFAGVMAKKARRWAHIMNKVSAVIFGGLAARLALN